MRDKLLTIMNAYGVRQQLKQLSNDVYDFAEIIFEYESAPDSEKENIRERILKNYSNIQTTLNQFRHYYNLDDYTIRREIDNNIATRFDNIEKQD